MLESITYPKLMSLTIKALYSKNFDPEIKDFIFFAAHKNGLLDEKGQRTARYYELMNDDLEVLIRSIAGQQKQASGLCACGCGRNPAGRGKYATAACRNRVSRTSKRLKKRAA
jgi:hypothetical protein